VLSFRTEVSVCCQRVLRRLVVGFVNLIEPVAATLAVGLARRPILAARTVSDAAPAR
jgi:hypothetical protein